MGFIDSIRNCFSDDEMPVSPCYRLVMFGDRCVYFENVLSIVSYSEAEMILRVKNGGIKISGKSLYIKKYCQGDMAICGTIKSVEKI